MDPGNPADESDAGQVSANVGGFGQVDPTDNRSLLDWESKYSKRANSFIILEATYLGSILFICPVMFVVGWLRWPQGWLSIPEAEYNILLKYGLAWLSGTLGGVLFGLKWLYHVVARQLWHLDRRLWRFFTPHISGGLAFGVLALIDSGLIRVLDQRILGRSATVVGISFLVGYFSDSSIAKLTELAETLFGTSRSRERHRDSPPGDRPRE